MPEPQRRPRRFSRARIIAAVRAAERAGFVVRRIEVAPDGAVAVDVVALAAAGDTRHDAAGNEWDALLDEAPPALRQ
jgi:hypothetical protein